MDPTATGRLIATIGVYVQLGGTALLLVLFYLLARQAGSRPYFLRWSRAWLALLVALAAVALRYALPGTLFPGNAPGFIGYLLHGGYFFAKLVHYALLVGGAWLLCRQADMPGGTRRWILGAFLLAAAAGYRSTDLNAIMRVQQPLAVVAYLVSASLLFRLPKPRRTRGTRFTAAAFTLLGALWLVYGFAFFATDAHGLSLPGPLDWLPRYNSFLDTAAMILLACGQVVILLEDAEDATERVRAERVHDLADSEARLRAIIDAATDGVVVANGEGTVVLANAAASRLFGVRRREAIGKPVVGLFPESCREAVETGIADVHRATPGRRPVIEGLGRTSDGHQVPLEIAASTFRRGDELLDIFVLRDVSDRRRNEAERAELQNRLAQSLRTEALGRLVSGVAHELNNPLAAILTFSEQLLTERPAQEVAGPLGTIREQARRARTIVRDLLTFVRRREERRAPADMGHIVERTVRALGNDFTRQGVRFTLHQAPGLPTIVCDATAIEQVLTNLLDNAARATPGGEVTLTVTREGDGIRLQVDDDGPGIPPEHFSRLFEPFFTTRGTGEGTGLGLPVSLGIIEQHGGVLRAENRTPGLGARFIAWLPLGMATAEVSSAPVARGGALVGAPGRVLLIDDELPVRQSLRRYFERQGWEVEEAPDGQEGIGWLEPDRDDPEFDLVICDLKMPQVSGMEVHRWIRSNRPELLSRLVFASGDTATPETAHFLASNECAVLEKPFELADLAAAVSRVRGAASTAA